MSTVPPVSIPRQNGEVIVAGATAPGAAASTRMAHVKKFMASRRTVWRIAILSGAGFLYGAATDRLIVAAVVPAAALLVAVLIGYAEAVRAAALDFYISFAYARGFSYTPRVEMLESTPLLGAGDRRHCDHYMDGQLSPELPGVKVGLGQYTFEVSNERRMRRNRTVEVWTPYRFTIAAVVLESAIEEFPGVFLSQRRGVMGRISGESWLDYERLQPLELESSELAERYELHTRRTIDETRLMELFQPSFQVWLSRLPYPFCFEFSGGVLVVYTSKPLEEAGPLDIMLQVTAKIAKRFLDEAATSRAPLRAVQSPPASVPPPGAGGVGAGGAPGRPAAPAPAHGVVPQPASVPPPALVPPPASVPPPSVPPPSMPPPAQHGPTGA